MSKRKIDEDPRQEKKLKTLVYSDHLSKFPKDLFKHIVSYAPASTLATLSKSFEINPIIEEKRKQESARLKIKVLLEKYDDKAKDNYLQDIVKELNIGHGILVIKDILDHYRDSDGLPDFYVQSIKRFILKYIKSEQLYIELLFIELFFAIKLPEPLIDKVCFILNRLFEISATEDEKASERLDKTKIDEIMSKCGIPLTMYEYGSFPDGEVKTTKIYDKIEINDVILYPYEIAILAVILQDDRFIYHTMFNNNESYYDTIFELGVIEQLTRLIPRTTPSILFRPKFLNKILLKLPDETRAEYEILTDVIPYDTKSKLYTILDNLKYDIICYRITPYNDDFLTLEKKIINYFTLLQKMDLTDVKLKLVNRGYMSSSTDMHKLILQQIKTTLKGVCHTFSDVWQNLLTWEKNILKKEMK